MKCYFSYSFEKIQKLVCVMFFVITFSINGMAQISGSYVSQDGNSQITIQEVQNGINLGLKGEQIFLTKSQEINGVVGYMNMNRKIAVTAAGTQVMVGNMNTQQITMYNKVETVEDRGESGGLYKEKVFESEDMDRIVITSVKNGLNVEGDQFNDAVFFKKTEYNGYVGYINADIGRLIMIQGDQLMLGDPKTNKVITYTAVDDE